MEGCGFELVGSVDMSVAGGNNNVGDCEFWIFVFFSPISCGDDGRRWFGVDG